MPRREPYIPRWALICLVMFGTHGAARAQYQYSNIYSYTGYEGYQGLTEFAPDPWGNIFWVALKSNSGDIYERNANSHVISIARSFTFNGLDPYAPLVVDAQDNFFGVSPNGGPGSQGVVYKLPAGANTTTTIASFSGTDGINPWDLVQTTSGDLFGVTLAGAIGYTPNTGTGNGTLFKIPAGATQKTTIVQFNGNNGANPTNLVADSAGDVFGITTNGGTQSDGTVFELPAGSSSIITLANFNGANGAFPSDLTVDNHGNVFGVTNGSYQGKGPGGFGTVFEINTSTLQLTTLHTFQNSDGAAPDDVVFAPNGMLVGTTNFGGPGGVGDIFEIDPSTDQFTTLDTFEDTGPPSAPGVIYGFYPSDLLTDNAGNIFGVTLEPSPNDSPGNAENVFELSPIPEPSAATLLAIGAVGLISLRRRSHGVSVNRPPGTESISRLEAES